MTNPVHRLDVIQTLLMGCPSCLEFRDCGGLYAPAGQFRCTDACGTGKCKPDCDVVCPNNPDFMIKARAQVNGFGFSDIGRLRPPRQRLPRYISGIEHGYYFEDGDTADIKWAMIPLRRLVRFDKKGWKPLYSDGQKLREHFNLPSSAAIVVSCIDVDPTIVHIWRDLFKPDFSRYFARLDLSAVIVPNFSVFDDEPRTQHIYNRKRSLIVAEEFSRFGIPVIVYCHGRSPPDWAFWRDFLIARPDVTYIAKEFQTGLRSPARGHDCLRQLDMLQNAVGRPIHLVSVGGAQYTEILGALFDDWTLISQHPFALATKGERVVFRDGGYMDEKTEARPGCNFIHSHHVYERRCNDIRRDGMTPSVRQRRRNIMVNVDHAETHAEALDPTQTFFDFLSG